MSALLFVVFGSFIVFAVVIAAGVTFAVMQRRTKGQLDKEQRRAHEFELALRQAQEQLQSSLSLVQRLNGDMEENKRLLADKEQRIEHVRDQQIHAEKHVEMLKASLSSLEKQLGDYQARLNKTEAALEVAQQSYMHLKSQRAELQATLQERDESYAREIAGFEKQKQALSEHFKVLSNEILEAKALSLQENNLQSLSSVMNPFQKSLDVFKKEVQDIHHRETTQQGQLRRELQSLKELNQQITQEAHALSTALHGQKKLQGNWGELILENVLDRSGLHPGKDYQREVSIKTEEGVLRPDVVVYLPQNKHLIIDAKVSLNAYTRFVNAEEDLERASALKEHVRAMLDRIKELADRDYQKLPGLNSPEMVFMFVPIESAFVEALKADESVFQFAIEKNILVATPTTLLTSLNIVRQLWRFEDQNKHTAALADKAESVFKKLNGFLGSFEKIKKNLDSASSAYMTAENQLLSGRGNLVKQVGDFKNLAPVIKAELPNYFIEKAELEVDFIQQEPAAKETESIE